MPNEHTFTAVIQNAGGGGAFVEFPFDHVTRIEEAKKDEARQRRNAKTLVMRKERK